jgi:hypothetical protein
MPSILRRTAGYLCSSASTTKRLALILLKVSNCERQCLCQEISLSGSPLLEFQARVLFLCSFPWIYIYTKQGHSNSYRMVPMFWSWSGPLGAYDVMFMKSNCPSLDILLVINHKCFAWSNSIFSVLRFCSQEYLMHTGFHC